MPGSSTLHPRVFLCANARRLAALAAIAGLPLAAVAQQLPASAEEGTTGGWAVQLTPYVWASGVGGDLRPLRGGSVVSMDKSFSEVMKDLDAAFFLTGYARKDRLVLLGDISYSSSSRSGKLPPGLPASGSFRQASATLAAGHRAVSNADINLDLLAGLRAWSVKASVDVAGGLVQASPEKRFVDPVLGLRAHIPIAPRWSAIAYGDVGGFGLGSRATHQVAATVNYQWSEQAFVSLGYRVLTLDYRRGGTRIDVTMAGPLLGATWRF